MNGKSTKKLKRLITAGAVFAALAASVFILTGYQSKYLLLRNGEDGRVIFFAETYDGESFSVSFTHSVNKSPVSEYYVIRSGTIYLTELRYRAFGAGMPTETEEEQKLRYEDGDMVLYGFEREMTYLCYFIGRTAEHTLNFRGREIPLKTLDEAGQPILFTVETYPRILVRMGFDP